MCLSRGDQYCLDPLCVSNDKKPWIFFLSIVIHIIIAIVSGVGAHRTYGGDYDSDVFLALMWTAMSPLFDLIVILEQGFICGPSDSCKWFFPGFFRLCMLLISDILYSITLGLTFVAFNSDTTTFSGNVIKANTIILSVLFIPILLWYTCIEINIICCCQFEFKNTGGYSGGGYSNEYTSIKIREPDAHTYNYLYCSGTYTTHV